MTQGGFFVYFSTILMHLNTFLREDLYSARRCSNAVHSFPESGKPTLPCCFQTGKPIAKKHG
jgi:hypothetical protein